MFTLLCQAYYHLETEIKAEVGMRIWQLYVGTQNRFLCGSFEKEIFERKKKIN